MIVINAALDKIILEVVDGIWRHNLDLMKSPSLVGSVLAFYFKMKYEKNISSAISSLQSFGKNSESY